MGSLDEIRAIAALKPGYQDTTESRRAIQMMRPQVARRPSVTAPTYRPPARPSSFDGVDVSAAVERIMKEGPSGGPGAPTDGDGWGGLVRDVFGGIITVADAAKNAYQTAAGETGDLLSNLPGGAATQFAANTLLGNPFQLRGQTDEEGNRDSSFDFGDLSLTGSQFLERAPWTEDLPGPVKPVVGFLGDIATDPLTYVTAGTVKGGTGAVSGVARSTLAADIARQSTEAAAIRGLVGGGEKAAAKIASQEIIDELTKEAGSRGLGALTTKGLKRIGTNAEELRAAGINVPDFRYTIGVGQKARATIAPRKVAESVEDFKGVIKNFTGGSAAGKLARRLAYSSKTGERELMDEILSGGADAPTAALALSMMRRGRGEGFTWMFQSGEELNRIAGLKEIKGDARKRLIWELENVAEDQMSDVAKGVRKWLQKAGEDLQKFGIEGMDGEILKLRQGYVPHRLTQEALDNIDSPAVKKWLRNSADRKEAFQKARELNGTIDEINAKFKAETALPFNLLSDDIDDVLTSYLEEGKDAIMRSYAFGKQARDIGLVQRMDKVVDKDKMAKAIGSEVERAQQELNRAIKIRRRALDTVVNASKKRRTEVAQKAVKARETQAAAQAELKRLTVEMDSAKSTLQSLTASAAAKRRALGKARGAEKAAATRAVKQAEDKVLSAQKAVDDLGELFNKAERDFGRHAENLRVAEADLAGADKVYQDALSRRQAMNDHPLTADAQAAAKASDEAEAAVQRQEIAFAEAKQDWQTAGTTNAWLAADQAKIATKAEREVELFDQELAKLTKRGKVSKTGRNQMELNIELRDRVRSLTLALKQSDDPAVQTALRLELQAHVADMQALRSRIRANELNMGWVDQVPDIFDNPKFQDFIALQTKAGFAQIGDTPFQTSAWYKNAVEKQAEFLDPALRSMAWQNANKFIRGYRKALGWWKGYAVATLGFHVRNFYSGAFGMYIDGVTLNDARRFEVFRQRWARNPDAALEWATKKWGKPVAQNLDTAVKVTAASGWGITAEEAGMKMIGKKWGINPLKPGEFAPTKASQMLGESVEAAMRGGHAFSVLQRGGSFDEALQRVQKFHFNYRDISEFDQAAKLAMPFWTFFSRNMALQAQVWAKNPGKLNRSYFNAKRNLEFMSEEDANGVIPDYLLNDMGGIRTPWGGEEGGRMYITPDLPSIRFRGQMEDPLGQLVGGLTPALKAPLEALTNTNQFTGRPYQNELTQMSKDGPIPRLAPGFMQVPGIRNVIDMLPGTQIVNDKLLMTDRTQSQVESLNPWFGRVNRLLPNMPRQQETWRQSLLSGQLGAPVRWNDPGAQAGELARRTNIIKNEAANRALQEQLNKLTGG